MDGGFFPPNTLLAVPPDSAMDLDYMDELLSEGCLLEATNGSEFLPHSPTFSALLDPSFIWSTLEASNGESSVNPLQKDTQEERQKSSFPENLSTSEPQGQNPSKTLAPSHNMVDLAECSDLTRSWWIGPKENPGPGSSVMDRLIRALGCINDAMRNKDVLIQIWVPVNGGGRSFLTTNNQPFSLDLNSPSLASYRDISVNYQFLTEENSLPGRVFKDKVPEWTPDVRFFRSDEYARVGHAQQYGVRGTLALPLFEQGSHNCLGVIEVIMTTQKANYRPELESVCKALEAVDLKSSEVSSTQNAKACNGSYQPALPEILEVLRSACETHRLPLAQTWVPCIQQGKGGSRHSDENYVHCVSTVDSACYVADSHMQGFLEACSEHHLLKGQGVVGQAFMTNQPCFSSDVTSFTKTEYPLSHHARMFGLHAAVAIRLRSIYTSTADFVLEFFLPLDCSDFEEQKKMLASLSTIIQKFCQNLRIINDKELEAETVLPVDEEIAPPHGSPSSKVMPMVHQTHSQRNSQEGSSRAVSRITIQESGSVVPLFQDDKPMEVLPKKSLDFKQPHHDSSFRGSIAISGDHSSFGEGSFLNVGKTGERRRTKAETTITLQILRQYFGGSLKDAAKSIGVCPTTLKRICRQHGIKRWPSRKIKKVGHSLQKIQLVIDSVQGASGAFQMESFCSNFPFPTSKPSRQSKPLNIQPEGGTFIPQAAASISPSSSCSRSSSSSQFCSSWNQLPPGTLNVACSEDPMAKENSGNGVLKRVRSDTELHASSEHSKSERLQPVLRSGGGKSQEGDSLRVKVTYGEEKIRFHLDDDSEWILLTCDADLEECIDLCGSSQIHTIKLSLSEIPS